MSNVARRLGDLRRYPARGNMVRVALVATMLMVSGCATNKVANIVLPTTIKPLAEFTLDGDDQIFALRRPIAPWGDYGSILYHGMTLRLGRSPEPDGELQLERAGPAVPPISFPADGILITDQMKHAMEQAGFIGIEYRPVDLARVVEIDWQKWNLNASEPEFYPDGGSPELYILNREHSIAAAEKMGRIWEIVIAENAKMNRNETDDDILFEYVTGSWGGNDIFRTDANGLPYVSSRAMRWFTKYFPDWMRFQDGQRHLMHAG